MAIKAYFALTFLLMLIAPSFQAEKSADEISGLKIFGMDLEEVMKGIQSVNRERRSDEEDEDEEVTDFDFTPPIRSKDQVLSSARLYNFNEGFVKFDVIRNGQGKLEGRICIVTDFTNTLQMFRAVQRFLLNSSNY